MLSSISSNQTINILQAYDLDLERILKMQMTINPSFSYLERASGKPRLLSYEHHNFWEQIWGAENNGGNGFYMGYHGEP